MFNTLKAVTIQLQMHYLALKPMLYILTTQSLKSLTSNIAAAQQRDACNQQLQSSSSSSTSLKLQPVPVPTSNSTLLCDMCTGVPGPYVLSELRHTAFVAFHSLSHPSIRATQRLITARYVWPNINNDIHKWAQTCLKCQQCKVQRHTVNTIGYFCYTRH